ncbi:MAG: DNA polymerase III subunit epsilon, partial [Propionibacterium sp.]|nr:DNA polymerase III subunit epsilon [Propionibacterium sp.]
MPRYRGTPICDLVDDVNRLKRDGRLDEALALAQGCMDAMVADARAGRGQAMEFYVTQVAIILRRMRRIDDEARLLQGWLASGIPPSRDDHRVGLRKRLAKAHADLDEQSGRDPSQHLAEWRRLVAEEKALKQASGGSQQRSTTGRSAARPGSSRRGGASPLIPPAADLLATEFVAVDFETANRRGGVSACQVALIKFVDGRPVDKLSTHLKPPGGWDHFEFTGLHGISWRDIEHAPSWPMIEADVHRFVDGVPVFAHNASFDRKVWSELDQFFAVRTLPERFYCTYRTATRLMPGLPNYRLPTVVGACAPDYWLNHHDATADAEACGLIVSSFQRQPELA